MQVLSMYTGTPNQTTTKSSQVVYYPPRSELRKFQVSSRSDYVDEHGPVLSRLSCFVGAIPLAWGHQKSSKHDDIAYDVSIEVLGTVKDPRGARTGRTTPDPAPSQKKHTLCIH